MAPCGPAAASCQRHIARPTSPVWFLATTSPAIDVGPELLAPLLALLIGLPQYPAQKHGRWDKKNKSDPTEHLSGVRHRQCRLGRHCPTTLAGRGNRRQPVILSRDLQQLVPVAPCRGAIGQLAECRGALAEMCDIRHESR